MFKADSPWAGEAADVAAEQVMDQLVQDTPDSISSANTVIWNVALDRDWHWGMHRGTVCASPTQVTQQWQLITSSGM